MLHPIALVLLVGAVLAHARIHAAPVPPPNVVVIFVDDMGWGDLGCYGARGYSTPHLDQLAREGTRFTSFYVAEPVCSASRAALLTGCYAPRVGLHGALGPNARMGLSTNESTLARLLGGAGYTSAIFGKWHLGREAEFLPTAHGFSEYLGLPYSNDMWPHHPTAKPGTYPPLPLLEGTNIVEVMPDQRQLTRRYTERAVSFIERHRDRPFFLYLAHSMPHAPLHASGAFAGATPRGLYGDVIEEIDWSVGRVLDTLRRQGLEENTWVIFTSDNGPWHNYGDHAGSAGPFREGKGATFEGGIRVPCLMRWPGRIPAGRSSDEPLMTIDLLPTLAGRCGATPPPQRIDGRDVWPLIAGVPGATNPHPAYFFYYEQGELQALRSGPWKLHFPHTARGLRGRAGGSGGQPVGYDTIRVGLELYNLMDDPGEQRDVAAVHPEVVRRLTALADGARADLGDRLTATQGAGVRPAGRVPPSSAPR